MRTIVAEGMTLEPQVASHAPAMFELLSDDAIYEYENEPPASLDALRSRFERLESRRSPDGSQQWLNWVIRLRSGDGSGDLAGYVQATVHADGRAAVAYVLGSRYWGRGIATEAVRLMMGELAAQHGATRFIAILKSVNKRSYRLLERLGFAPGDAAAENVNLEGDELLMVRPLTARAPSR
jgi:RimJ/RimL family protein N-acetyltransferase